MPKKSSGKVTESDIQRGICDWLSVCGLFFWRSNNVPVFARSNDGVMRFRALPKFTPKGLPDILLLRNGKLIGFEVKRPGAKLTDEQEKIGALFRANGGEHYRVESVSDVARALGYAVATQ